MLLKLKLPLFVLFAFLALSSKVVFAQGGQQANLDLTLSAAGTDFNTPEDTAGSWTTIPANLQRIGGNGNGDYHYWGALQFGAQAIADQAVRIGLWQSSEARMVQRTSRFYTFNASQYGNYTIGLNIRNAQNLELGGRFIAIVSNSGNWWLQHIDFTYYARYNGRVYIIRSIYDNYLWSYQIVSSNANPGQYHVYDVQWLPPTNGTSSYDPTLWNNDYSPADIGAKLQDPSWVWLLEYGTNYVLNQAWANGQNMTVQNPANFDIAWIYQAWDNEYFTHYYEVLARAPGQDVRLSFQISALINGILGGTDVDLYSWSISNIRVYPVV